MYRMIMIPAEAFVSDGASAGRNEGRSYDIALMNSPTFRLPVPRDAITAVRTMVFTLMHA